MIRRRWSEGFLLAILCCISILAIGQADTLFVKVGRENAIKAYTTALGTESHLYNGVLYKEYYPHKSDQGIPYFLTDDWVEGSLNYDDVVYDHVPMMFDLTKQKLVIDHPYAGVKLELISDKISTFQLHGHTFVRLLAEPGSVIQTGFYDVIHDGITKAYGRYQKNYLEVIETHEIQVKFDESNRFYINKKGQYYQVKNKGSILEILGDKKTEIRKFIHKNKIKYRKNRADALARITTFYDQSTPAP